MISHKAYGRGRVLEINKDIIKVDFGDKIPKSFSIRVLVENNLITINK